MSTKPKDNIPSEGAEPPTQDSPAAGYTGDILEHNASDEEVKQEVGDGERKEAEEENTQYKVAVPRSKAQRMSASRHSSSESESSSGTGRATDTEDQNRHIGTDTEEVEAFDVLTNAGGAFQRQFGIATNSSFSHGIASETDILSATMFDILAPLPWDTQTTASPDTASLFHGSISLFPLDASLPNHDGGSRRRTSHQLTSFESNQPTRSSPVPSPVVAATPTKGYEDEESSSDRKPAASKLKKQRIGSSRTGDDGFTSNIPGAASVRKYDPIGPDPEELAEAKTKRAKKALLSWYERLRDLYKFRDRYGHTRVPQNYYPNSKLAHWVNKQRMAKKAYDDHDPESKMTPVRIAKLELAGFIWAQSKGDDAWELRFEELQQYVVEKGNPNVPTKYQDNPPLGRWVSEQRKMYKKYIAREKYNKMLSQEETERRIGLLQSLGFNWRMVTSSGSDTVNNDESQEDDDHEYDDV